MKKYIIAALVMLLVCTTGAFAIYDASQVTDYAGFSVGASYVNEAYDIQLLGGNDGREKDKALQLNLTLTDYVFVADAPVGIYMDMGALINLKSEYTFEGGDPAGDADKSPLYADVTIGAAFKTSVGSSLNLFAAVGPEFTYFTREYDYYYQYEHHKVEKTFMTLGVAANAELMLDLGGGFYLSAGARASIYFLKWMTNEDSSWWQHQSYSKDTENYFGWRGTAKAGVYYAF